MVKNQNIIGLVPVMVKPTESQPFCAVVYVLPGDIERIRNRQPSDWIHFHWGGVTLAVSPEATLEIGEKIET